MKQTISLLIVIVLAATVNAQTAPSSFRRGYTRLGIQMPGNKLVYALSPKDNMLKGNFGNDMGFVLEKGRIFYFIPQARAKRMNVGLDWTVVSADFTPTGKAWQGYVKNTTGYAGQDFSSKFIVSLATKLGPVLSINPVGELVIDVRVQAGLGAYGIGPVYETYQQGEDGTGMVGEPTQAFYPYPYDEEATGIKPVTQAFHTALKPDIGTTVRWRTIGLAVDYSPGNINMKYKAIDNGATTTGQQKVPWNKLQLKLTFNGK